EPRPAREIIDALLAAAGVAPVHKSVSFAAAYAIGAVCEAAWTLLPLAGEPPLTRFLAEQLATTHWYDMTPARRDFGYVPKVTIDEGLARLAEAYHRS
ncbi:MAG: 3-beta hydroxysteroid dehydrogenase, partial [Xanthomonadaceae bacterium]|nr:3-beta hydroxysteroid dehydrogenase [Xanthomonadaceae bacterium]